MILMSVRQNDPLNVGKLHAIFCQLCPQCVRRFFGFWPDVDQRKGVFLYQIDIDVAYVKGRGN